MLTVFGALLQAVFGRSYKILGIHSSLSSYLSVVSKREPSFHPNDYFGRRQSTDDQATITNIHSLPLQPNPPSMAVATESFLHLARPLAPQAIGAISTTAPINVIIQPQVSTPPRRTKKPRLRPHRPYSPFSTMPSDVTSAILRPPV